MGEGGTVWALRVQRLCCTEFRQSTQKFNAPAKPFPSPSPASPSPPTSPPLPLIPLVYLLSHAPQEPLPSASRHWPKNDGFRFLVPLGKNPQPNQPQGVSRQTDRQTDRQTHTHTHTHTHTDFNTTMIKNTITLLSSAQTARDRIRVFATKIKTLESGINSCFLSGSFRFGTGKLTVSQNPKSPTMAKIQNSCFTGSQPPAGFSHNGTHGSKSNPINRGAYLSSEWVQLQASSCECVHHLQWETRLD